MANSVVKVTDIKDEQITDRLYLLVGEDGTVTPDQDTVETFLKQRNGPTNIQIMKINKSDKQGMDISVDNVTYMPDVINEEVVKTDVNMDEVARNLYNFKLDHDYTPLTSPFRASSPQEEDELAKKLSMLDGPDPKALLKPITKSEPPPLIITTPQKAKIPPRVKLIQSITITPPLKTLRKVAAPSLVPVTSLTTKTVALGPENGTNKEKDIDVEKDEPPTLEPMISIPEQKEIIEAPITPITVEETSSLLASTPRVAPKGKAKIIKMVPKKLKPERARPQKPKTKIVKETVEDESDDEKEEEYLQEEFDFEMEDDENDSDYEEEVKVKPTPKRRARRSKSESKNVPKTIRTRAKSKDKVDTDLNDETKKEALSDSKKDPISPSTEIKIEKSDKNVEKLPEKSDKSIDKSTDPKSEQKLPEGEMKPAEKKSAKKEKKVPKPILDDFALFSTPDIIRRVGGKEPTTPGTPNTPEPTTKPAKITQESRAKSIEQPHSPTKQNSRHSIDSNKSDKEKEKEKEKDKEKHVAHHSDKGRERRTSSSSEKSKRISIDEKPKGKDNKSLLEHKKNEKQSSRISEMAENILNSDEMPSAEDIRSIILSEDTKSFTTSTLSMDTVLNNSDPSNINLDGTGLDLDPTLLDNLNNDEISEDILYQVAQSLVSNPELQNAIDKGINEGVLNPMPVDQNVISSQTLSTQQSSQDNVQKGTQIIRPDGRIVVIPPIERPATRSRNKKVEEVKPTFKPVHKPLDDEHVSGNELDSSGDEEEESEDDPNKLWCICNQPHNNRFMICCDTCEEWYHGKCVNITKTMGQQMEAEGKEWICLFCKDPSLKRPQAAARRIRKASRNSRTSTESSGSASKKVEVSVPCVVCQKPSRKSSIYCSEACILAHAQGIERVVVFERSTGKMLTGNKAPSAANLDQWLKEHPGYEVVRSGGKVVTAKAGTLTQSKLKLVKNNDNHGVSLAIQKKGVNVAVMKHSPKHTQQQQQQQQQQQLIPHQQQVKTPLKANMGLKLGTKQLLLKEPKTKLIPSQPQPIVQTPTKQKQTVLNVTMLKPNQSAEKKQKVATPKEKGTPINKEKTTPKDKLPPKDKQTPKTKPKQPEPSTPPTPKPQENIRENVQKTVFEQLTNRLKGCEDIKLTEEEVKNISIEIESQLYKCFGDTGQKYRNKYRSLIFNIKDPKNHTLWRRICDKSIGPYELVRLSPDDMASQELAKWRENEAKHSLDMIKKSELELLNCNRQYVLKTHKGEQVVEDDRTDKVDNTEVIKTLTEGGSTLDSGDLRADPKDRDKKSGSKHSHKDKDRDRDRKLRDKDHKSRRSRSSSRDRDRDRSRKRSKSRSRSRSRDHKHGDHKKHSRDRDRHKKSHRTSRHKKDIISSTDKLDKKSKEILEQLVDNKIVPPLEDRLWKHVPQDDIVPAVESDSDHEPSSTVTIPTPPRSQDDDSDGKNLPISPDKEKDLSDLVERSTSPPPKTKPSEIWRGMINMVDVAQISITAHEVSGDCSGLGKELSENLDIVGRISPDTVWEYIGKMKCSNSKGISLIRLNATNIEEKMPYLALYSYLSSRDRLGVVKSTNKAVKDFYIYPLAPQKPIPQVLLPIYGPGFEESRPALLLGIIVRDKRKTRTYIDSVLPAETYPKKMKPEPPPPLPTVPPPVVVPPPLPRSYTPPPMKDPRLKLTIPSPVQPLSTSEGDEPYSPGDSSPDPPTALLEPPPPVTPPGTLTDSLIPPTPFASLPGAGATVLPSAQEIQRQVEELNKKIEMEKSEITSMTKNIVSASSEIGSSALANIALPSNLQQILDSIKTIGDTTDSITPPPKETSQTDLTIPLMIPKTFTRPLNNPPPLPVPPPGPPVLPPSQTFDLTSDTIPLNLPSKPKIKPHSVNSPLLEEKMSVLGSLSEEDLIRKAAEMLGEEEPKSKKRQEKEPLPPTPPKRAKQEISLPPVPGLEDEIL